MTQGRPDEPASPSPPQGHEHASPRRLPLLVDAVLSVGTDLELRATLQQLVDAATRLTGARYGALGVVGAERGGRVTELFTAGVDERARARIGGLPDGHSGVIGELLVHPKPLRIDDLTTDPHSSGLPPGHPPMHSFLGVPILVADKAFGNLYLAEKQGGPFTAEDEQLLRVLAAQAGIAIGNARLYETARQRERWISGTAAVTTALMSGGSPDEALTVVAEQARQLAEACAGVILQPTDEGGMEIVAASTQEDPGSLIGTTIAPGSPVLEQLLGGEAVFVSDSATDARMTTPVSERFGPSMLLPLQSGGRLIGTLALPRVRGDREYTPVERQLATQFASQAALALVLADARRSRGRLAVYEDRDRIARDLHDLVIQRLFATGMMLESARRRAEVPLVVNTLGHAVEELESTVQEVRTTIFALQQPPSDSPAGLRDRVLREAATAAAIVGFQPSVQFTGPVDNRVGRQARRGLLLALRRALAAATRRAGVTRIAIRVDADAGVTDDGAAVRLTVHDDGAPAAEPDSSGTTVTWESPL
ncbi:Hypoxia sensor histidine kinase response regulator DosT [Streptomyces sp. YIM 130001]|uniref:GAF domain-containing protein n=1 Tax=Streptomyces sp. YIM 130001 TaxID=2259644 RepID=UPI000E64984C|nr:GAF domain-containing protein [Streptomyces sp. YIM 130001]RII17274.1 Hypoxia sensor histidine kinase response regulator DosT [Streptomyces sp. YIM 130001]